MKIKCPVYDLSCPYCVGGSCCMEEMDGADPQEECDAFFGMEDVEGDYEMGLGPYLGCYTDDC